MVDVDARMHHAHLMSAFADAGIDDDLARGLYEVESDPAAFGITLEALGATADEMLTVGDRSVPDGGMVEAGITTLLLPPLRGADDQRLHRVLTLCPAVG